MSNEQKVFEDYKTQNETLSVFLCRFKTTLNRIKESKIISQKAYQIIRIICIISIILLVTAMPMRPRRLKRVNSVYFDTKILNS